MVSKLFDGRPPTAASRLLDPGCGDGEFIEGVLRACAANGWSVPEIVGVELDEGRAASARSRFCDVPAVRIEHRDFLQPSDRPFDYIIGNPPYVSILELSPTERLAYRTAYRTARGRFDLYVLFIEQALRVAKRGARLVMITPEKYLYVQTAVPLRELLRSSHVEELDFACEATFAGRVTYPLISTITAGAVSSDTRVIRRDRCTSRVTLPKSGAWLPAIEGFAAVSRTLTLDDVALRISCGVATGADAVFVLPTADVPPGLRRFAYATVSGRQILPSREIALRSSMLAPYDRSGKLLPESELGELSAFLRVPARMERLLARTCVSHKPWYAYHDNFPLADMLRPKLLCKDITEVPFFVPDLQGHLVPRHSVYYVVPAVGAALHPLSEHLNSGEVTSWLRAHCQRAANGYLRLQSHVLKDIPLPAAFAEFVRPAPQTEARLDLVLA